MKVVRRLLVGIVICVAAQATASVESPETVLRVYGPGGPHHVMQECAELFRQQHGVAVDVVRALPHHLEQRVREDGDIYYGGAEYMLEAFDRRNPGVLDMSSVARLHPRRIGIVVRKGNPLGITAVADLIRDEIDLLDVKLENMRHLHGVESGLNYNIRRFEYTGKQGADAWLESPEIDAWVTYRTWHLSLQDESDFVAIPGAVGLRYTPVALTRHTQLREEAQAFIDFLQSEAARRIFEEHGWY